MTKCPSCKSRIIIIKSKQEDNTFKKIYLHPETVDPCTLKDDGTEVHVLDPFLQNKFRERLFEKESILNKILNKFRSNR